MNWAGYLSGSRRAIQIVAAWWGHGDIWKTWNSWVLVTLFKHVQTPLARIQIQAVSMQSYSEFPIQISDLPELKTELCGVLYKFLAGRTWELLESLDQSGWLVSLRLIGVLNQQPVVSWWHCTHCNHEDIGVPNILTNIKFLSSPKSSLTPWKMDESTDNCHPTWLFYICWLLKHMFCPTAMH